MIWCEPFCGSAAVGIRLLQKHGKPPISYMGGKSGYADIILGVLGLSPGQGCGGMVLGDVGPWAAVHATLGGAGGSAVEVARWVVNMSWCVAKDGKHSGYSRVNGEGHTFDNHGKRDSWSPTTVASTAQRLSGPRAAEVAAIIRSWRDEEPRALWERLKAEGWPSLLPTGEGRWLGPCDVGEVARWAVATRWSFSEKGPEHGYGGPGCAGGEWGQEARDQALSAERLSKIVDCGPTFPPLACWQGQAQDMPLPDNLDGWVIFADPPYQGTSGYPHGDCPRATVLALAEDYSRRGAVVAISEAVPLDRDLPGWVSVRIDGERKGAKRTWSKQQAEYLTMNREPAHRPAIQVGLWGGV